MDLWREIQVHATPPATCMGVAGTGNQYLFQQDGLTFPGFVLVLLLVPFGASFFALHSSHYPSQIQYCKRNQACIRADLFRSAELVIRGLQLPGRIGVHDCIWVEVRETGRKCSYPSIQRLRLRETRVLINHPSFPHKTRPRPVDDDRPRFHVNAHACFVSSPQGNRGSNKRPSTPFPSHFSLRPELLLSLSHRHAHHRNPASTMQPLATELQALDERLRAQDRAVEAATREVEALRRENAALVEKVARKDKRISELLEEKFGLADQLQKASIQVLQAKGRQDSFVSNDTNGRRKPSGFTILPPSERKESKGKDEAPNLHDWAAGRRPSKVKPRVLSEAAWLVTEVPEEDRTGFKEFMRGSGGVDEGSEVPPPAKKRRLDPRDIVQTSPNNAIIAAATTRPERPHSRTPRRYRGPPRKAVCTHCWTTRQLCGFSPRCKTCVVDNEKCVRKLCEDGEWCLNSRCPCLHPGEWDEREEGFVVERGRMPRR